ncbi:MAG: phytoene/squalene synthase family protein [Pseudomonadota bacterium]
MPKLQKRQEQASEADWTACRDAIREGSQSFYAASLVLPAKVRDPAYALYAFCRLADDAVDEVGARADALASLHVRLDAAYRGQPLDRATDRAFADTVARHAIPKALPAALLEGLAWDRDGRLYHSASDLYSYAARVASAVGAMMTLLMGVRSQTALARACDLGVAMQLTNIARDVGEDARMGRLYLPRHWLKAAGVDPEAFLANPRFTPEIGQLTNRLLDRAELFYDRSAQGIGLLPANCRPGIAAARLIYREIGRVIAAKGYDSVSTRAVVTRNRKLALVARAVLASLPQLGSEGAARRDAALAEVAFLLEAVEQVPAPAGPAPRPAFWDLGGTIGQMAEMLHDLEKRDRLEQTAK